MSKDCLLTITCDEEDRARMIAERKERNRSLARRKKSVAMYRRALDNVLPGLGRVYAEADKALISGWDDDVSPHVETLFARFEALVDRKTIARIEAAFPPEIDALD